MTTNVFPTAQKSILIVNSAPILISASTAETKLIGMPTKLSVLLVTIHVRLVMLEDALLVRLLSLNLTSKETVFLFVKKSMNIATLVPQLTNVLSVMMDSCLMETLTACHAKKDVETVMKMDAQSALTLTRSWFKTKTVSGIVNMIVATSIIVKSVLHHLHARPAPTDTLQFLLKWTVQI